MKKLLLKHSTKDNSSMSVPKTKCRICGEIIKITKWRKHLALVHDIVANPCFKDYFVKPNALPWKIDKRWHDQNRPAEDSNKPHCGAKIGMESKWTKIIYNPVFTKR